VTKDEALKIAIEALPELISTAQCEFDSQHKAYEGYPAMYHRYGYLKDIADDGTKALQACKEALEQEERTQRTMHCGTADAFIAMDDDHKRRWFVQSLRESKRRKELEDILEQPAQIIEVTRDKLRLASMHKMQDNIDAITRAIDGKPQLGCDMQLLVDTKYILIGMAKMYGVDVHE
jgi:hypothetical protein